MTVVWYVTTACAAERTSVLTDTSEPTSAHRQVHGVRIRATSLDPEDWKVEEVPLEQVNEFMDDLVNGRNTNSYRYILKW